MPVTPTTEEEKKKKKKKKTFRSVTGVRFKDLILPLALGGISAYSRPAARGAQVGLAAYKTFLAGQEVAREQEAGEMAQQYFTGRAEALTEARDKATGAIEDPTASGNWLYHGQQGPTIPTPTFSQVQAQQRKKGEQVLAGERPPMTEEEAGKAPFENIFDMQQEQLPFYMQQPEQQASGIVQGLQAEPVDPTVIQESITNQRAKAINDYKQRIADTQQQYDEQIRMSEMAAMMSPTNPAWATGLMMQHEQANIKQRQTLGRLLEMERIYSTGRKEQAKIDADLATLKHGNEMDKLRLQFDMEDKWFIDPSGEFIVDKKHYDKNGKPIIYDGNDFTPLLPKLEQLDTNQTMSQWARYMGMYEDFRYDPPMKGTAEWDQMQTVIQVLKTLEKNMRRAGLLQPGESGVGNRGVVGAEAILSRLQGGGDNPTGATIPGNIPPANPYGG